MGDFTPEQLRQYSHEWQVSVDHVAEWVGHVRANGYYATAIMCPAKLPSTRMPDGEDGMLIAISTAESTRIQKQNMIDHQAGRGIGRPYWHEFDLYWYVGLAFLNFSGITDSQYQGQKVTYTFGTYLRGVCSQQGSLGFVLKPMS